MPIFTFKDELHAEVKPLNEAEKSWVRRLEKLLMSCPTERLELITIGDPALSIFDNTVATRHDMPLEDGKAERAGLVLAHVKSRGRIHGVSG